MFIRPALSAPLPTMRRVSRAASPYAGALYGEGNHAYEIMPAAPVRGGSVMMGRSFSAQLLELGLRHQVDGLVKKASAQIGRAAPAVTPHDHYEQAQHNFADPHLVRWYV